MRVRFTQAVMEMEGAFAELDRLVYFFQDGRHHWGIDEPDEARLS